MNDINEHSISQETMINDFYKMILGSIIYYKFHRDRAYHLETIDKRLHFTIIFLSSILSATGLNDALELLNTYKSNISEKIISWINFAGALSINFISLYRRIHKLGKKSVIHSSLANDFRSVIFELQFIKDYQHLEEKDYNTIKLLYKNVIRKNMIDFHDHATGEFIKDNKDIIQKINTLHNISILPLTLIPEIIDYKTLINTDELKQFFDQNINKILNDSYSQNNSNQIVTNQKAKTYPKNIIINLYKNFKNIIHNFTYYFKSNNKYEKIPINDSIIIDTTN